MKRCLYSTILFVSILVLLVAACSCEKQEETVHGNRPVYNIEQISDSVRLDAYTDLSIVLEREDSPKGDAIWSVILERAEVLSYPEEAVEYYAEQERQACRYYAKQQDLSYEAAMEQLGLSEQTIEEKAKAMVKEDLVYEYIRADAGIALTENEKSGLFDRYALAFAEQYGYAVSEVKESMADFVYESMLYDKTMEYLIVHNTFTVSE